VPGRLYGHGRPLMILICNRSGTAWAARFGRGRSSLHSPPGNRNVTDDLARHPGNGGGDGRSRLDFRGNYGADALFMRWLTLPLRRGKLLLLGSDK